MIKLITMMRRKPGITAAEFRDYEENSHVPLVREIMGENLIGYVRHYPNAGLSTGFKNEIDYDLVVASIFPDMAAYHRAMAAANEPENRARLKQDYSQYLDVGSVRQSLVEVVDG